METSSNILDISNGLFVHFHISSREDIPMMALYNLTSFSGQMFKMAPAQISFANTV
jgi:hypothetical protein